MQTHIETEKKVYTVSYLNRCAKQLLETHFSMVWVEGEISNLSRPSSGHLYFTLKDESAQVRCALFRARNSLLSCDVKDGMHILASAKISLYEGRGDFQLIIEHLEERGEGLLRRKFEMLKNKLAQEGLFDLSRKKPLPLLPKKIGVITSSTGAAIRDVLSILKRRCANIPVIIYPTLVQGEHAPLKVAQAIELANTRNECDVLIICRGGGSLEDLFAFNEEIVARAIYKSIIPTVSAIGHEIDYTIADFVADQRAATPSAAAELLSPNKKEYLQQLQYYINRLCHLITNECRHFSQILQNYQTRLIHPGQKLQNYAQTLDLIEQNLIKLILQKIHYSKQDLTHLGRTLQTVSPLNTLERGYSITTKDNHVVSDITQVNISDPIKVEVKNGFLFCVVDKLKKK